MHTPPPPTHTLPPSNISEKNIEMVFSGLWQSGVVGAPLTQCLRGNYVNAYKQPADTGQTHTAYI